MSAGPQQGPGSPYSRIPDGRAGPTPHPLDPAMSASSAVPAKGGAVQTPSPLQTQLPPPQPDTASRRPGGSGSFGAGSSTRPAASPRNRQTMRKNHKPRRPKLAAEDAAAEAAAIRSTSSRKGQTSITHLMNFSLPPRPQNRGFSRPHPRRNPTWGLGSGHHAVDKARYIHANYRFIVDPRGDYKKHTVDADIHLDWNLVLQILASAQTQGASCPICLSTPVAPRMAKCGHIFCLPCLIRYMHSTDDATPVPEKKSRWKKCPICWDTIYMAETRPLRWYQGQEGEPPQEGGDVILRLVVRKPGSILALPRDGAEAPSEEDDVPWFFQAEVPDYARIMKGSEEYMLSSFDHEIEEIELQEKEDELMFGEETVWTRKAVSTVEDLKERAKGLGNPPALSKPEEKKPKRPPIEFNEDVPHFYAIQTAAATGQAFEVGKNRQQESPPADGSQKEATQPIRHAPGTNRPRDEPFYFYQALMHYYLSPLDIRILKAAFGDYSTFPATILPRVERVSTGHIVDDDLRKRAKYLGHLPKGCEVGFLECNWTDVVAPSILTAFSGEIERRRKRNREKAAREEKDRLRAEKEEDDKRWAAARRKRPSISRPREPSPALSLPATSSDPPLLPPDQQQQLLLGGGSGGGGSVESSSPPRRTGSAFASLASPSTSPTGLRTVWGTAAVPATDSPSQLPVVPRRVPYEHDGWLENWEHDLLGAEERRLVAQVEAASLADGGGGGGGGGAAQPKPTGQGGKKKKNKKITLMSTNARRAA